MTKVVIELRYVATSQLSMIVNMFEFFGRDVPRHVMTKGCKTGLFAEKLLECTTNSEDFV